MKNLKAIQFLAALSPAELKLFDKYVHSSLHNTHKRTVALFDHLKKYHPHFPEAKIEKQKVFQVLFPEKPYDEKKIYDIAKYLQRLILKFLSYLELSNEAPLWEPVLHLSSLYQRKMDKHLGSLLQDAEKELKAYPYRDESFFYFEQYFNTAKCNYILHQDARSSDVPLQSISESLDHYYLIRKLRIALSIANRNLVVAQSDLNSLIQEALHLYNKMGEYSSPVAQLYFKLLKMLRAEEASFYYQEVRQDLRKEPQLLTQKALYEAYMYVVNYCSYQIKRGQTTYWEEIFTAYEEMLAKDIFFFYPSSSHSNVKNYNNISIRLKKYQATADFLENYGDKIDPTIRQSVIAYCNARLYFAQAKYEDAKKVLLNIEFQDPFDHLNYNILMLKLYYETEEFLPLISLCKASLIFIKRNKSLSESNKKAYANMVKFCARLANFRMKEKKNPDRIKRDFEGINPLVDRIWIKEKIQELDELLQQS